MLRLPYFLEYKTHFIIPFSHIFVQVNNVVIVAFMHTRCTSGSILVGIDSVA